MVTDEPLFIHKMIDDVCQTQKTGPSEGA